MFCAAQGGKILQKKKHSRKNNSFYSFLFLRLYSHNSVFALPGVAALDTRLCCTWLLRGGACSRPTSAGRRPPSSGWWSRRCGDWRRPVVRRRDGGRSCHAGVKRKWDAECDQYVADAHFSNFEGLQKRGLNKPLKISVETQVWLILYHLILYLL